MSLKTVYININQQVKKLTFQVKDDEPEIITLRRAFNERIKQDPLLGSLTASKILVFQVKDSREKLCDIEEWDIISDGSDINVVLFDEALLSSTVQTSPEKNQVCVFV